MKLLRCFPAVIFDTSKAHENQSIKTTTDLKTSMSATEVLIPLSYLNDAARNKFTLGGRGGRSIMTANEVRANYGPWVRMYEAKDRYDLFLSYRWNMYDSQFTQQLFDMITNFGVGSDGREIDVFLDTKRLKEGTNFKGTLGSSVANSRIIIPIVSLESLERLISHNADFVDNLLLEWIITQECAAYQKEKKVFPILFGTRVAPTVEEVAAAAASGIDAPALQIQDFFNESAKDELPKLVPKATLAEAATLLKSNNIPLSESFNRQTVHSIVHGLLKFLCCKASDINSEELVEVFATKAVDMLSDCVQKEEAMAPAAATAAIASPSAPVSVPSSQPSPGGGGGGVHKALEDLSVEEVGHLMEKVGFGKLKENFAANEITGMLLACCDEAADLQDDTYGVSKPLAKGLIKKIVEWKEKGVDL